MHLFILADVECRVPEIRGAIFECAILHIPLLSYFIGF